MNKSLIKYKERGVFEFTINDNLNYQCNAPRHSSGIYLIYREAVKESNLIYIGISGRQGANGEIVHRKDGLGGRLVKGKQFGEARRKSWPKKMKEDCINKIIVNWYVTHGKYDKEFPRPLEIKLLKIFYIKHGKLPNWNNEI